MAPPTLKLNDGHTIPAIALGTWRAKENEAASAVEFALKNGYTHIDTAYYYGNEEEVGRGIHVSGVPRKDIFVTTKLWNDEHKNVANAFHRSLKKLDLDYIDLFLIHWPISLNPDTGKPYEDHDYVDTWREMQKLLKTGKVRSIGVSNFDISRLERLLNAPGVTVKPVVNQIEAHPLLTQPELTKWCADHDIVVEAFAPLGSQGSHLLDNPDIKKLAEKYNVDAGRILISWGVQRKTVVLPKSSSFDRIALNLKIVELEQEDFEALNKLSDKYGVHRSVEAEVFETKETKKD